MSVANQMVTSAKSFLLLLLRVQLRSYLPLSPPSIFTRALHKHHRGHCAALCCVCVYATDRYFNSSTHFSIENQAQNRVSSNEINQSQSAHSSTLCKCKISSLIIRNNSFGRKSMHLKCVHTHCASLATNPIYSFQIIITHRPNGVEQSQRTSRHLHYEKRFSFRCKINVSPSLLPS